jgi:glycylpeptide N-tetradecanoyltransferase
MMTPLGARLIVCEQLLIHGCDFKATHLPTSSNYLMTVFRRNTKLRMVYSVEEFAHVFLPQESVINTYVLESASSPGTVTDMCSFYHLPSTVIGNPVHSKLFAVYSYYNVATTIPFVEVMADVLVLAASVGVDVFNALDAMENLEVMETLKFGIGDGFLQYYLYNWKYPEMPAKDVGLILL